MEGRKEGREGGKGKKEEGRKERLTLPKGNSVVLSTKIWPLLWGKATEFDIYKIF